jgi:hypothetical protein
MNSGDTFVNIIYLEPILHYVYIVVVLYIFINSTFRLCIYWFVTGIWKKKIKKNKDEYIRVNENACIFFPNIIYTWPCLILFMMYMESSNMKTQWL